MLRLPYVFRHYRKSITLWTNPDDVVVDPFNGVGSSGYQAVKMGRKYIGIELKESYFDQAVKNLCRAKEESGQSTLFDDTNKPVIEKDIALFE